MRKLTWSSKDISASKFYFFLDIFRACVLDDSYVYCKKSDNYKDASVKRDMLMNHINSLALCSIALFLIACLYFCQLYPHFSIALFLIACLYLCQSCFVLFVTTSPIIQTMDPLQLKLLWRWHFVNFHLIMEF
jgi:hypothetical protein